MWTNEMKTHQRTAHCVAVSKHFASIPTTLEASFTSINTQTESIKGRTVPLEGSGGELNAKGKGYK
jgi:hypothetical protein